MLKKTLLNLFIFIITFNCVLSASAKIIAIPDLGYPGNHVLEPAFSGFLSDRLGSLKTLAITDGDRLNSVSDLLNLSQSGEPKDKFESVNQIFNIDYLVYYWANEDYFTVMVASKDSGAEKSFPLTASSLYAAGEFVCKNLELSEADTKKVLEKRFPDADAALAFYFVPYIWTKRPVNPGEYMLKTLEPYGSSCENMVDFQALLVSSTRTLLAEQKRKQDYANKAIAIANLAIEKILGTPFESSAYELVSENSALFTPYLLELTAPLLNNDDLGDLGDLDALDDIEDDSFPDISADLTPKVTFKTRCSALRVLGHCVQDSSSFERIMEILKAGNLESRRAAAEALAANIIILTRRTVNREREVERFKSQRYAALKKLTNDPDKFISFVASYQLWKENKENFEILSPTTAMSICIPRLQDEVTDVIAQLSTEKDLKLLIKLEKDGVEPFRSSAVEALLRIGMVQKADIELYLKDYNVGVVKAALKALKNFSEVDDNLREAAISLANDPYAPIRQAAILALENLRPKELKDQMLFDLRTQHTYFRLQILNRLAGIKDYWAKDLLMEGCTNSKEEVRAEALVLLAKRDIEQARDFIYRACSDSSPWVRLNAACLAEDLADSKGEKTLEEALKAEKDPATRAYLEGALAKARGELAPKAMKSVNLLPKDRNVTWLCGNGLYAEDSPFEAYYQLSLNNVNEQWRKAHNRGKIFFPRLNPIGNSGEIIVKEGGAKHLRESIDKDLTEEKLPFVDGLVFGEETMNMRSDGLWEDGWPLFCRDAGIDPETISGDKGKLSETEEIAWQNWSTERMIDGFNQIYEYIKLKYGKLRPGIQVATFLPGDESDISRPAIRRWKFDIGALYDYKGDNRLACYSLLRRYKTIWPERRSLWLSLGIGGYEMNPVKYNSKTPQSPFFSRNNRCYADSLTAWLAGADTGWFSVWIFVNSDYDGNPLNLSGTQVLVESIAPQSPLLLSGLNTSFRGVAEEMIIKQETDKLTEEVSDAPDFDDGLYDNELKDDDLGLEEDTGSEELKKSIQEKIKVMQNELRLGFNFYQLYVYDCVRVFASLPRLETKPKVLVVREGITTWTRPKSTNPMIPGAALVDQFDFLTNVNMIPHINLNQYLMLVIHNPDRLRDSTIKTINQWLKTTPGLLYIHRDLTSDNSREDSTIADLDGKLENDWVWEKDVTTLSSVAEAKPVSIELTGKDGPLSISASPGGSRFDVTGKNAEVLYSANGKAVLVLWQHPDYKGAVLFDGIEYAGSVYLETLRRIINELADEEIGIALNAPRLHLNASIDGLQAASSAPYYGKEVHSNQSVAGIDLLTGLNNAKLGGGRGAVISTQKDYINNYVAIIEGIHSLAEKPFVTAEKDGKGLLLKSSGMIRVTTEKGTCTVETLSGKELPVIPLESAKMWLVDGGKTEGVLHLNIKEENRDRVITYIRSKEAIKVGNN